MKHEGGTQQMNWKLFSPLLKPNHVSYRRAGDWASAGMVEWSAEGIAVY